MKKFLLVLVLSISLSKIWQSWPDHYLHVIACDVGQGDATLIMYHSIQVVIDGGKDEQVLRCLGKYLPVWDKEIELVVATHPDADHIGGLAAVLSAYRVKKIIITTDFKETADFERFYLAVQREEQENAEVLRLNSVLQLQLGERIEGWFWWKGGNNSVKLRENTTVTESTLSDTLQENTTAIGSFNDRSIISFLRYGQIEVLLLADLEKEGEVALRQSGLLQDVEVLKVGHHGSKTSTTLPLLQEVTPEIGLISAGKNNNYGHPHSSVLERLNELGVQVYRTDREGSIELVSDGESIWRK